MTQEDEALIYLPTSQVKSGIINEVLRYNIQSRRLGKKLAGKCRGNVPHFDGVHYNLWKDSKISFIEIDGAWLSFLFSNPVIKKLGDGTFDPLNVLALPLMRMDLVGWPSKNQESKEAYRVDIYDFKQPLRQIAFASPYEEPAKPSLHTERMAERGVKRVQFRGYQIGQGLDDAVRSCFSLFESPELMEFRQGCSGPAVVVNSSTRRFHKKYL